MFRIKNNALYYETFGIVRLDDPFHRVVNIKDGTLRSKQACNTLRRRSVKSLLRKPSECTAGKTPYRVRINPYTYGNTYVTNTSTSLKSFGLYMTNTRLSTLFRGKVMTRLVSPRYRDTDEYQIVTNVLKKLSKLILKQSDFNSVVSDFLPNYEVAHYLTNLDGIKDDTVLRVLEPLLSEYSQIPLRILDKETFEAINVKNTTIDIEQFRDMNVAVFIYQNPNYAGFLAREIRSVASEVLPVTAFLTVLREGNIGGKTRGGF